MLYVTNTLSLAMMPQLLSRDRPQHFAWEFQEVEEDAALELINEALAFDQLSNSIHLPQLADYVGDILMERKRADLPDVDTDAIRFGKDTTILLLKYRGPRLRPTDRELPMGARVAWYKCVLREYAADNQAWQDTVCRH